MFRFLYLCCYSDLNNKVVWGNGKKNLARKKDLHEIFECSSREYYRILKVFEENKLIKYKNDYIVIPTSILKHTNNLKDNYNRYFTNGIKSLYVPKNKNIHEKIGTILSSLPRIAETETNLINNEICNLTSLSLHLGFSNVKNLNDNIKDIIAKPIKYKKQSRLIINPFIFYNGKDVDNIPLNVYDSNSFSKEVVL